MTYQTLAQPVSAGLNIKKSEFISYAYPVPSRELAMFHVEQLRKKYPDARHHCWAYIIGDPNNTTSAGFDDDGEPSGTAGKPILNVLQHKRIGNIIIVVVRYFGGIKLGSGGLTRAYAGAAQAVIKEAANNNSLTVYVPIKTVLIKTSFAHESQVRYVIEDMGGEVVEVIYAKAVTVTATLAACKVIILKNRLATHAQVVDGN